ncbi:DUF3489 domain-containing protein [Methylobacterium isbiliense]|uniref:DUF3489 domain-containing protein n=1 Tax=Methylobacterium isbiliense TaxID=315478 RepID=A0ABQ4SLS9_9HYPH|nr:DUF3489 domain-containing protein [Methylobacterium isbiliense]MDN3626093.1 DUF3489 domain-containing protein [Methylobacterium isbiliense]GJE04169.1 hypothetical protein GMJLKIPL_6130 [Methylobacterium isbiliense]
MPPLSPTQLTLLTAALTREDRLLVPPPTLKGGARERVAAALLTRAMVDEVKVGPEDPAWHRRDGAGWVGLCLTVHGAAVAGPTQLPSAPTAKLAPTDSEVADTAAVPPRPWTKTGIVLGLLGREQGASLAEITAATGWLPHTARAALSRLRPAHPSLVRVRSGDGRGRYHLPTPAPKSTADREG